MWGGQLRRDGPGAPLPVRNEKAPGCCLPLLLWTRILREQQIAFIHPYVFDKEDHG